MFSQQVSEFLLSYYYSGTASSSSKFETINLFDYFVVNLRDRLQIKLILL